MEKKMSQNLRKKENTSQNLNKKEISQKKYMLPLRRNKFFPDFGAPTCFFLIFTKIQGIPSGIPGNFQEVPKILLFSKKYKKCPRHDFFIFRAMVTHNFFLA